MAGNMKGIQERIKSVTSTKQITHAMKLVASAKLRHARERADKRRAYTDYFIDSIHLISGALGNEEVCPLLKENGSNKNLYLVITADKGLAGGFTSNLLKFAVDKIDDKESALIVASGNKGVDFFKRRNYTIYEKFVGDSDDANYDRATEIGRTITDAFLNGDCGNVYIIYNRFVSVVSQKPEMIKLLPLTGKTSLMDDEVDTMITSGQEERKKTDLSMICPSSMIFEPSPAAFIEKLIPGYITSAVYGAMLESAAGELAARRMAMENASDNADELIASLGLKYNRLRQGAITQEITEIAAGANAIGG